MKHYDTIVIGGGHNGLVCATYLARNGQSVLVLEASDQAGGLAAPREFHPGYQVSVAHSLSHFSAKVARELDLTGHGCTFGAPLSLTGLNPLGDHVVVQGDDVSGVGEKDRAAFKDYRKLMKRFAGVMKPAWLKTMPRLGKNSLAEVLTFGKLGLGLRRLGKADMGEFMRVAFLPARDLVVENFENEILQATLSWDGLIGSKAAPRSPNNTVFAMWLRMSGEHDGDHVLPNGGMKTLVNALLAAAKASGAEVRTASRVQRILVESDTNGLATKGVELADGTQITADRVVSGTDPQRTFLDLVGARYLEIEFTNRINRLRCHGYVAKLHLALSDIPKFKGIDRPDGRMIIAPDLDAIEFAYDDAKYGESSENPVMEILVPSLQDTSQAPDGKHVLSAHIMYVPYERKDGWTDAARDALCDRAIDTIEKYAPGLRDLVIHKEILTPLDLERTHNVTGGHWHHTEFALDQILMMRPTYEAAQYSTPISGLYVCGAGSHPGGGLMGAAGHNAAHEILK